MSRLILAALWVVGAVLLGNGVYMDAKAKLAQVLIASSWDQRTADRPPPKPWWWADTRAVARMKVARLDKTLYVMQDDSGESLAFGPGHLTASAKPATEGHIMIAGHRDSHFAFLKDIRHGDVIEVSNYKSETTRYRVSDMHIMDTRKEALQALDEDLLTLITCYPFEEVVPGGPLRLIVNAEVL